MAPGTTQPGPAMPGAPMGAPPGFGGPPPGAMMQAGAGYQPGMPAGAVPYAAPIAATGAPSGEPVLQRSPISVLVLACVTCGIYGLFWYAGIARWARSRGAEIPTMWFLLVPILNLIWFWKFCKGIEHASRGQLSAGMNLVLLWILGGIGMFIIHGKIQELKA